MSENPIAITSLNDFVFCPVSIYFHNCCDMVEPFRFLIDIAVKKAYNLKQIKEEDFLIINHQYKLKWEKSPDYISFLMKPIIENKESIFKYIQQYYRCFMKDSSIEEYPFFKKEM